MKNQPMLIIAALQQLVLAITFVLIPIAAQKYGKKAQDAAENSLKEQGLDGKLLRQNGIKFTESKVEMLLPFGFALAYLASFFLIMSGNEFSGTLTLILTFITFIIVGAVTAQQVFAVWFLKRAFKKSNNSALRQVDVEKFIAASLKEFPAWLQPLQIIRFLAATVGSAIVLLLALI